MGLFDSVSQFFQDNVAENVDNTVQNVTDSASQVAEEGGVNEAVQNVAGEQLAEVTQQAEEMPQKHRGMGLKNSRKAIRKSRVLSSFYASLSRMCHVRSSTFPVVTQLTSFVSGVRFNMAHAR